MELSIEKTKIGIIGLGYVGLPLAVEFGKKFKTLGYDVNNKRVMELNSGLDNTLECSVTELAEAKYLTYTTSIEELKRCNVYIVTVPTPIDKHKQPDLSPLKKASKLLGNVIDRGDVVIYESTVYPGATEDECIPVVEQESGLVFNEDFFAGYSPERINPGDKLHRVTNIHKVTSGSNPEVSEFVDKLYQTIIVAGTHKASSIRVAEASKVIENVQRDVNIALVNELHQVFSKLDINTKDVIDAAATKWNFMKLTPGLVGGHCIGVDPYYLLHKSQSTGYIPDLIRKSREINDSMPSFIASDFTRQLIKNNINPINIRVALLGFAFKENCPDVRNTKVFELYLSLKDFGYDVVIYDSVVSVDEVKKEYGIEVKSSLDQDFEAAILTTAHSELVELSKKIKLEKFIYDYKGLI